MRDGPDVLLKSGQGEELIHHRLPPLTALRAFEATARRLSVARASEELRVTPGAVSHHIKALEGWLGLRLFRRANNSLSLTPLGQSYLSEISAALGRISDATEKLAVHDRRNTLTIVVPPSFCTRWLVPRLHRFRERVPHLELRISVVAQPIDFTQHMMDVGIGFGWDVSQIFQRRPWVKYHLVAVCSPALVNGPIPLRGIADLKHHTLIHDDGLSVHDRVEWRTFMDIAGTRYPERSSGLRFNRATDAIDSAIQGYGVALARSVLVINDIQEGRLLSPFDVSIPGEFTYDIVGAHSVLKSAKVLPFIKWLEEEAASDAMLAGRPTSENISSSVCHGA